MIKNIKIFLLKWLPFSVLNFLRAQRGFLRVLISQAGPEFLMTDKFKAIKIKSGGHLTAPFKSEWANAFSAYAQGKNPPINLLWVDGPMPGNFGDWLSPYILHSITNQKIVHIPDYSVCRRKHIVGLGSIANKINLYSHVFGAGIAKKSENIDVRAKFHFVRGPHTRNAIIKLGGPNVEIFGDMGFVLSKIYCPLVVEKDIDVLFVRHLIHQNIELVLPENFVEYSINASGSESIKAFIDTLLRAKAVVTSAMHCYIACKSYGVPCALVDFSEAEMPMFGDGIKYQDAMLGAGFKGISPFRLDRNLSFFNFDNIVNDDELSEIFVNDLFEHIKKSIATYHQC
jgi:hypothetical protein